MSKQNRVGSMDRRAPAHVARTAAVGFTLCLAVLLYGLTPSPGPMTHAGPAAPSALDAAAIYLPIALSGDVPHGPPATAAPPPTSTVSPSEGPPETPRTATDVPTAEPSPTPSDGAPPPFAPYVPVAVGVVPAAPDYVPDLGRVANPYLLERLSADQRAVLERNGFVVVPAAHEQFHHVYTDGRGGNIPAFVTTDALLHTYHVLYGTALRSAEQAALMADANALTTAMLQRAAAERAVPLDGAVRDAAVQTAAFFAVAARLLDPACEIPGGVTDVVTAELDLIAAHEGVAGSPIFGYDEDYSQYVPRGHYTRDEAFQRYFRAMIWYGRMGFRLDPKIDAEVRRRETRAALLIVHALYTAPVGEATALDVWDRIYDVTAFFVGTADDLTVHDYAGLARDVYGYLPTEMDLRDDAKLDAFIAAARTLRPPAILSTPLSPGQDKTAATMGFRFMGQRYIPDSAIFQQLVYDEVKGPYRGQAPAFTESAGVRSFPRGLDVPAALGSARALDILTGAGDTNYGGYDEQLAKVRDDFGSLEPGRWTSNLYWSWLNSLSPLLDVPGEGFPFFMQSEPWVDKSLNAWLGSWAQLRHDTILYAKPSMPIPPSAPVDVDGYVEPNPWLYARLAALTAQMRTGLRERGLLAADLAGRLDRMETLLLELKAISEAELVGEALTDAQHALIRNIGFPLASLVRIDPTSSRTDERIAVVADVHSVPAAGLALEEAVGDAFEIYVVLPQPRGPADAQVVMRGGVFSYYEFKWPMADRLTDEQWQAMDPKPALPEWTGSYLVGR